MSLGPLVFQRDAIGISHLGAGMVVVADIVAVGGLVTFLATWGQYPRPWLSVAAWCVLILAMLVGQIVLLRHSDSVPHWGVPAYLIALAVAVVLDLAGSWDQHDVGSFPTAALTTGAALLVITPVTRLPVILMATGALGIALAVAFGAETRPRAVAVAPNLIAMTVAMAAPVVGGVVVNAFRVVIQRELDRVQAHSRVDTGRVAAGIFASEDLAQLDSAAEQLLDSVATGRTRLPLDPPTASAAAALATELRLHLIAGRRETWLHHAVAESAFLAPVVTVRDPDSLAGLLDRDQRDGLLSAAWLLVGDLASGSGEISIDFGSAADVVRTRVAYVIRIVVTTSIAPGRVDAATTGALRRVGMVFENTRGPGFRANIDCRVERPVDS